MNSKIFLPQVFFSVAFKLFHCIVLHLAGDKKTIEKKLDYSLTVKLNVAYKGWRLGQYVCVIYDTV